MSPKVLENKTFFLFPFGSFFDPLLYTSEKGAKPREFSVSRLGKGDVLSRGLMEVLPF